MKNLQQKHKEWCEKNFGGREPRTQGAVVRWVADCAITLGKMAHCSLKHDQGIRGGLGNISNLSSQLRNLSDGLAGLTSRPLREPFHAFKNRRDLWPLLGALEEVGELFEAHRDGTKEERVDAVGDIVLYLMDYCNKVGIDFEDAVRVTAEKVHKRDWVSNPVSGEVGK